MAPQNSRCAKIRRRLKAIEEIEAASAMGEYPLLLDCLPERSRELEHAQSQKEVKESFVEMACSGVPPILLTRVVTYAGKVVEESLQHLKFQKKLLIFTELNSC